MLFRTTEELKEFLPVTAAFDFKALAPFIEIAEVDDIIPYLGQEQYDELDEAYNSQDSDEPTEDLAKLLKIVRKPLIAAAWVRFIPFGNITAGKGGFTTAETNGQKIASAHRIEDLKNASLELHYKGIERMLQFLEKNFDDYETWADSPEALAAKENFINTAIEFNKHFGIRKSRRTFTDLLPIMQRMEEMHILPVLGQALYDEIKEDIAENIFSDENSKLLKIIRPAVANFTISQAALELPVQFTASGLITYGLKGDRDSVVESAVAEDSKLDKLHKATLRSGNLFKTDLQKFLRDNKDDYQLYEFVEPVSVNNPDSSIHML